MHKSMLVDAAQSSKAARKRHSSSSSSSSNKPGLGLELTSAVESPAIAFSTVIGESVVAGKWRPAVLALSEMQVSAVTSTSTTIIFSAY
jgi:hypothetical protein